MDNRPSIFSSAMRAFFVTIFVMAAIIIGFIVLIIALSSLSSVASETTPTYAFKVLPDEEGNTKSLMGSSPVILQVDVKGVIGMNQLTTGKMRTMLAESRQGVFKDDRVKALLLYIDSPGGTISDAQGIFQAIKEYKERYKVPVYTYVQGLCASGGVYVASISDKIYADDVSLVGSVGVIMSSFLNLSQLLDKIGVQSLTLAAGKGKDAMNPLRPWEKDEDAQYKNILNFYYDAFVNLVTTHRPINKDKLINDYGAHVFPAAQAKEYGYIDEVDNSYYSVVKELVKAAGLEGKAYQLMHAEEKSWVSELFNTQFKSFSGKVTHSLELPPEYHPDFRGKALYLYQG